MAGEIRKRDAEALKRMIEGRLGDLSFVNPVVLSCGGIYIPHQGHTQRIIYHILTTANESLPVKVVTGIKPRNALHKVLIKESMN